MIQTTGKDDIVMVSQNGQTIRFAEAGVRPMGRAAAGVRGMKLREGDARRELRRLPCRVR